MQMRYNFVHKRNRRRRNPPLITPTSVVVYSSKNNPIQIDWDDHELSFHTWSEDGHGYVRSADPDLPYKYLHRLVAYRKYGRKLENDEVIDHKNGNPMDNRRDNLRIANRTQNQYNRRANRTKTGASIYQGVHLRPGNNQSWTAAISANRTPLVIGHYESQDEAAWMRDQWALELHGEFAHLNFDYV